MEDYFDNPNHPVVLYIVKTLNKVHDARISASWVKLTPTVDCGQILREALRQFQTSFGLSPTGQYDIATEQLLLKLNQDISYGMVPVEKAMLDDKKPGQAITAGLNEDELFILRHIDKFAAVASDIASIIGQTAVYSSYPLAQVAEELALYQSRLQFANKLVQEMVKDMSEGKPINPIWRGVDPKAAQAHRRRPNLQKVDETIKVTAKKTRYGAPSKASVSLRASRVSAVLKKAGLVGYGLQAACVLYHGMQLANADASTERQKSDDFINSLGGFYGTVASGVATGAVAGSFGGLVGMAIAIAVAVLDVVLVAATGKSIGDYLFEMAKYLGGDIYEKQMKPLAHDMVRFNTGGLFDAFGNFSPQFP